MSKTVQWTSPASKDPKDDVVKLDVETPHSAANERRVLAKSLRESVPRAAQAGAGQAMDASR